MPNPTGHAAPTPRREGTRRLRRSSDQARVPAEERHVDGAHARPAERLPDHAKHDHLAEKAAETGDRQEALLDEAIEETFPGSDPISPKHIT